LNRYLVGIIESVGILIIILGLYVSTAVPYTITQSVKYSGETAEALITETGDNPAGLWFSILGLAIVVLGATREKEIPPEIPPEVPPEAQAETPAP